MEYNQEIIDQLHELLSTSMRRKVFDNVNKRRRNPIKYSTFCDMLKVYREQVGTRAMNRRLAVYDEAVRLLNEKGITIKTEQ